LDLDGEEERSTDRRVPIRILEVVVEDLGFVNDSWKCVEPDVAAIRERVPNPLEALARADVPALVLRNAFPAAECTKLVQRLINQHLLYDPDAPVPDQFLQQSIPENYYRKGSQKSGSQKSKVSDFHSTSDATHRRIDVGTSLGYRGDDPNQFFGHAELTEQLFQRLFQGLLNPIDCLYDSLQKLANGKHVCTAHESDGRKYGPAIVRAHYGDFTYVPHFDSVRLREQRSNYAVYRFEYQFAGVLVLQNSHADKRAAQCVIHDCLWYPEIQPFLDDRTFHDYARQRSIASCRVELQPGDLYFFNTRCIHEVPGVAGAQPRIVLATFIGFSPDDEQIMVWS